MPKKKKKVSKVESFQRSPLDEFDYIRSSVETHFLAFKDLGVRKDFQAVIDQRKRIREFLSTLNVSMSSLLSRQENSDELFRQWAERLDLCRLMLEHIDSNLREKVEDWNWSDILTSFSVIQAYKFGAEQTLGLNGVPGY